MMFKSPPPLAIRIVLSLLCASVSLSASQNAVFHWEQMDEVELPNAMNTKQVEGESLLNQQKERIHRDDYIDSVSLIGEQMTQKILNFSSLSPMLLRAITTSFLILDRCNPTLLENSCYLEFGLYQGFSLWFAQQIGKNFIRNNFHYFGFDSFAGLSPSHDLKGSGWKAEDYACNFQDVKTFLSHYGADFSFLHLIEGWYSENLFRAHFFEYGQYKPAIITIDSDTYESAKEVLTFFMPLTQPGTILLFDEFMVRANEPHLGLEDIEDTVNHSGERKALIEFLDHNSEYQLVSLFPFGGYGYAFMVTKCPNGWLEEKYFIHVEQMIGNSKPPERFKTWSSHIYHEPGIHREE